MATRGEGANAEAEPVLIDVEDGRLIVGLDDGDTLSFDADEFRAELDIATAASEAETRAEAA